MNALERVKRALRHQQPDVTPVAPIIGSMAARYGGVSIRDYVTDGAVIARCQLRLCEALGTDMVVTAADAYYMAEGFGLKTTLHDHALPTAKGHPLESLRDAYALGPADPYRDGRMPVYLEAVSALAAQVKGEIAIRSTGTGPFSIAGFLLGIDRLFETLMDIDAGETEGWEEGAVRHLLDIAAQTSIAFITAQVRLGADIAYIGDSLCSHDMISADTYLKYVLPYHRRIVEAVGPVLREHDAAIVLHSCGNNTDFLPLFARTGIDMLDVDSMVDLAYAKEAIGREVCLCGNLNPMLVLNGTPEEVGREARQCIQAAGAGGGFVLSTGCFVAEATPVENLKAMVEAARAHPYS